MLSISELLFPPPFSTRNPLHPLILGFVFSPNSPPSQQPPIPATNSISPPKTNSVWGGGGGVDSRAELIGPSLTSQRRHTKPRAGRWGQLLRPSHVRQNWPTKADCYAAGWEWQLWGVLHHFDSKLEMNFDIFFYHIIHVLTYDILYILLLMDQFGL